MIALLARMFLRRRLRSAIRLTIILPLAGIDLAQAVLSGQAGPAESALAAFFTITLGTGLIGQERADGSLALLFTRPVTRTSVVIAAWLAASLGGLLVWLGITLLRCGLALLPGVDSYWSPSAWGEAGLKVLAGTLALGAVVTFFGVAIRGCGGLAAHAGLVLAAAATAGYARDSGHALLLGAGEEALHFLLPVPDTVGLLSAGGWSWLTVVAPASHGAIALLAAWWLLDRMQLSYSNGD